MLKDKLNPMLIVGIAICGILSMLPCPVHAATQEASTLPSEISDVSASDISYHSATISWKTNANGTSQVFYDTASHSSIDDYHYRTDEDASLVKEHSVNLTGLFPSSTYHYRVKSRIPETDSVAISDDYTFTTLSPCFIATAAYGTPTAEQIDILREFRDEVLLPNRLGAVLVSFYYRASPPIAGFISRHEVLRTIVRKGFIDPLVAVMKCSQSLWDK